MSLADFPSQNFFEKTPLEAKTQWLPKFRRPLSWRERSHFQMSRRRRAAHSRRRTRMYGVSPRAADSSPSTAPIRSAPQPFLASGPPPRAFAVAAPNKNGTPADCLPIGDRQSCLGGVRLAHDTRDARPRSALGAII